MKCSDKSRTLKLSLGERNSTWMVTIPNNRTAAKLERSVFSFWNPWRTISRISMSRKLRPELCNKSKSAYKKKKLILNSHRNLFRERWKIIKTYSFILLNFVRISFSSCVIGEKGSCWRSSIKDKIFLRYLNIIVILQLVTNTTSVI